MKKILLVLCIILGVTPLYAFTFPEPDWGALLAEKTAMVTEADFELYVEGDINSAPYFGARLEPRYGAYIGTIPMDSEKFAPVGSYLTYFDHMNQGDIYYPDNQIIRNNNSAVMVGWTINDMYSVDYNKVKQVLDTLATYERPMYIRFANEMNVSALGNEPSKYIEVFRKVADMVHQYENFAVVWSPNDLGGLDRPFEYFYPGDSYVDWVGVSCYSIRYFMGNKNTEYKDSVYFMTGDYAWATNRLKPIVDFMRKNNIKKPVMLSECGVPTNNSHGDDMEKWATPRFKNLFWNVIMKYPEVKMINYFNTHRANEVEKFDITSYPYAVNIFNEAANSGAYLQSVGDTPDFVFQKAQDCAVLKTEKGIAELYTLAYIPNTPDISVNYRIDGTWFGSSNQIPYKCYMDITKLTDGAHTLSIDASGKSKSYTFYKRGNAISFKSMDSLPKQEISVTVNGKKLEFPQQSPVISDNRTLVPLREIFEALGATVEWDGNTKTVNSQKGNISVSLTINSDKIYVNGAEKIIDVPAKIINNKTMVPVRAVSESYNCSVVWDAASKTVVITI